MISVTEYVYKYQKNANILNLLFYKNNMEELHLLIFLEFMVINILKQHKYNHYILIKNKKYRNYLYN